MVAEFDLVGIHPLHRGIPSISLDYLYLPPNLPFAYDTAPVN